MIRCYILLLVSATAYGQSFLLSDKAFLGTVQRRPYPQWLSYQGVTGSPASSWASAFGSIPVTQATAGSQPTVTASAFGSTTGLTFDGTADYLSSTNKLIAATGAGSLSVVFKTPATVSGPVVIVSQADSALANDWWEFGINSSGKLYVSSNAAGTTLAIEGSTVLAAATAYNAILTYDGNDYWLQLNGVEENPLVITSAGAFAWLGRVGGTTVFSIGSTCLSSGAARFFNGTIGAVAFWPRDITQ